MSDIVRKGYVTPDVLVSTEWVASHLNDRGVRLIESNEDPLLYRAGHIPGAVEVDWARDLNNRIRRDYIREEDFAALMSRIGVDNEMTVVLYGDKNNWWATYAFWVFSLFGHKQLKIMDGGRLKWEKEGRPLVREVPTYPQAEYRPLERDDVSNRAFRDDVLEHVMQKLPLVDVRSPEEYTGERLHMENYPNEGALRGGHIPGAKSVPWSRAVNPDDGTFRAADELRALYQREAGLGGDDNIVVYCRIGERSSHTWFVLKYLLGFKRVRNYDGSWTEWGNLVNVPIER